MQDEKRGAIFPASLMLRQSAIEVDGRRIKLAPGMNVTAEIKTGKRRVIDYLLDPVEQHMGEALKERPSFPYINNTEVDNLETRQLNK